MRTICGEQGPHARLVLDSTGGIGRKALSEFYEQHFIFFNCADAVNELVSRAIGVDRVCSPSRSVKQTSTDSPSLASQICKELITHFTHDTTVE